jgi:transcriptional regulator with XRE-family HTH domain
MGEVLGVGQSLISKIERGQANISPERVELWLQAVGVRDPDITDTVLLLSHESRTNSTSWRKIYEGAGGQAGKQRAVGQIEQASSAIRTFSTSTVPGLVQIDEYALRVLRFADPDGSQDHAAAVQARIGRQRVLYDRAKQFSFVVTEGALRWRPGPVELLLAQLDRIAGLMSLPNVSVELLPFDIEAPTLYSHGFVMYDLAEDESTMVIVETAGRELVFSEPEDIEVYAKRFDLLRAAALHGDAARALLGEVTERLRDSPKG